jgi:hypothetical protein
MIYTDGILNLRHSCPITYTQETIPNDYVWSLVAGSGTEGYDGTYRLTLDTNYESEGTYEMIIKGQAVNNIDPFQMKFVLHLLDFCNEMGKTPNRLTFSATPI